MRVVGTMGLPVLTAISFFSAMSAFASNNTSSPGLYVPESALSRYGHFTRGFAGEKDIRYIRDYFSPYYVEQKYGVGLGDWMVERGVYTAWEHDWNHRHGTMTRYPKYFRNGTRYQKYKINMWANLEPHDGGSFGFDEWDFPGDDWVLDKQMLYQREVGKYHEDKWKHFKMQHQWKCGSGQWESLPWAAHCVGESYREEFENDIFGANVIMEARASNTRKNSLGPELRRMVLRDISSNGLVVVGNATQGDVIPLNGRYPGDGPGDDEDDWGYAPWNTETEWALESHGFPLEDLDLNDVRSQLMRNAIKWTKVGGIEYLEGVAEPRDWRLDWRSKFMATYATAVSDTGDVIVGNTSKMYVRGLLEQESLAPDHYEGHMYANPYSNLYGHATWFEEKNQAFVVRGGNVARLPEGTFAQGVSGDGTVVVGGWQTPWPVDPNGANVKLQVPLTKFGFFDRDKFSALRDYPEICAMRWTEEGGIELLGSLEGATAYPLISPNGKRKYRSLANDVSANGEVIVGFVSTSSGLGNDNQKAFRWTESRGIMESLGDEARRNGPLGTSTFPIEISVAEAVSSNGDVIVGGFKLNETSPWRAFRWAAGRMQEIGVADDVYDPSKDWNTTESYAYDVSGNGRVVVGSTTNLTGLGQKRAFIYSFEVHDLLPRKTPSVRGANNLEDPELYLNGPVLMRTLEDWMRWNKLDDWNKDDDPGLRTRAAYATNEDGSIVVGELQNGNGFLMYVMPTYGPSLESQGGGVMHTYGMVDLSEASAQMDAVTTAQKGAMDSTKTIIHGAHSRPLSRRVKEGETTFWTTGDAGSGSGKYGNIRIAEVAASHNFGKVQAGMSLGKMWENNNDLDSVDVYRRSDFVTAELMAQVSGDLWMSVAGLYGDGQSKMSRYDAGNDRTLYARSSNDTKWLSVRLELDDGIELPGGVYASPYGELSYSEVKQAAYTELGEFGRASIDSMEISRTHLHIGADLRKPLDGNTSLIALVEVEHLLDDDATELTGKIIVNDEVSMPLHGGPDVQEIDNRVRVGFGLEHELDAGAGKLSGMLNAANDGEDDNVWLSLSYQISF
ncbi:MAG: autotransporter domain-containing protein [Candidatus Sedimenticola endophacoides]